VIVRKAQAVDNSSTENEPDDARNRGGADNQIADLQAEAALRREVIE
jgi:hypothetical protein